MTKFTFPVYRLDNAEGTLDNTNAGNLEAVLLHLDSSSSHLFATGDMISVYKLEMEGEFSEYIPYRKGTPIVHDTPIPPTVGREERGCTIRYSFPQGGQWNARFIGSVSLDQFNHYINTKGSVSRDEMGGVEETRLAFEYLSMHIPQVRNL